jgi:hypothetical protein
LDTQYAQGEIRYSCISDRKPERRRPFVRRRGGWENNNLLKWELNKYGVEVLSGLTL